ncbi:MAG: hypothetical protein J2P36_08765 [Ktedonobacteraceae bacterium]|nr:hypothetical protein [Ktedonobacteraceae bacterium]
MFPRPPATNDDGTRGSTTATGSEPAIRVPPAVLCIPTANAAGAATCAQVVGKEDPGYSHQRCYRSLLISRQKRC